MIEFFRYLRRAKFVDWGTAIYLLILNLVIGLLPIWATWIFFMLFGQKVLASSLIYQGEFAVYSAATLAATIYIISKNRISGSLRNLLAENELPALGFPGGSAIVLFSFPLLFIAFIIFFTITVKDVENFPWKLNEDLYIVGMWILLILAAISSLLVGVVDSALDPMYEEAFRNIAQKIKKETDKDRDDAYNKLDRNFDNKAEELSKIKQDNDLAELQKKFDNLKSNQGTTK